VLALRWSVVRSKGPHQTYVTFGWFLAVGQGVGVKFHKLGMAPLGWMLGVRVLGWSVVRSRGPLSSKTRSKKARKKGSSLERRQAKKADKHCRYFFPCRFQDSTPFFGV